MNQIIYDYSFVFIALTLSICIIRKVPTIVDNINIASKNKSTIITILTNSSILLKSEYITYIPKE